jgi:hypothetical protein
MSLINEALKRTRDASYQTGPVRTETGPQYRIRDSEEGLFHTARSGLWVTLLVVVMAGVAVSAFSLRMTTPSRHLREALSFEAVKDPLPSPPPATSAESRPVPFTPPAVSPRPEPKATPPVTPVVLPALEPKVEAPAPPPAPEPPKFVLQGITSAPEGREAMVNGYSVREGDELDGARVVAIESRRVKLQFGDREIVLRMP